MNISKEKVREIARHYGSTIIDENDARSAFRFVWEIICAEYDSLKESEPYEVVDINILECAEHIVYDIGREVTDAMEGFWA